MFLQTKLALFRTYLLPQWWQLFLLLILLGASAGLQVGNPQILGFFIDTAIGNGPLSVLRLSASLFLILGVLQQVLRILTASISGYLAWSTTNRLRADVAEHCLRLDMPFHTSHTPGELLERTDEDVSALNTLLASFLPQIVVDLLLLVCVRIVLSLTHWIDALALFFYALVFLLVLSRTCAMMEPAWRAIRQAKAELYGFVGEQAGSWADRREPLGNPL
jgi:ATP-binding cassette, subfamily B, bacterial